MTRPDEFYASIGGYMGPSYRVELDDGVLVYTRMDSGYEEAEVVELQPSDEEWSAFLKALDEIGVWSWEEQYRDSEVCDGTHWSFRIEVDGRRLETSGSNDYPGLSIIEAQEKNEEPHAPFRAFEEAVRELIGGREFR